MKRSKNMIFETKEQPKEEVRTRFYTIAKVYWVAVPLLYFFLLTSSQPESAGGIESVVSGSPEVLIEMSAQFSNVILAGLLFLIDENERTKTGNAGLVFKVAIAQQLFIGNMFGILVAILAHRELPEFRSEKSEDDKKTVIGKTGVLVLLGVLIVLSLVVGYGRWAIGN